MLLLAHAAMPSRVEAATVDHDLRTEAASEAEYVGQLCAALGIAHHIVQPSKPITGSIQAQARTVRYALLADLADATDCAWIATAHHADDQLETVLMRVARGSGVDGLAAVRQRQGKIIRPMLEFRKAELDALCADCNAPPVIDPSNDSDRFDRVLMRKWLATTQHPFDAVRALRTAQSFADASEALAWMTDRLYQTHVQHDAGGITLDTEQLPRELLRRLSLRIIAEIQPGFVPRGEALDQAMDALANDAQRMLGNVLCEGGAKWRFRAAPERRN